MLGAFSKLYRLSINSSHNVITQDYNVCIDTQDAGNFPTSNLLSRCLGSLIIIGRIPEYTNDNR
jgi:hypothetical protein